MNYQISFDEIYDRTTGVSGRGDASVLRVVWAIIYFGRKQKIDAKDVLLDYNANKHAPSEVLFQKKLFFYQINNHFFSLKNRILLLKALLSYLVNRNKKQFSIKYAELLAVDHSVSLPQDINIYFYNPYTIRHYLLLKLLPHQSYAKVQTPYYLVFQADNIWANRFVSTLYDFNGEVNIITPSHIKLNGRCTCVRFYWTNIQSKSENEQQLRQFAHFLNEKGIKVEIFLHYLDRATPPIAESTNPLMSYNLNNSMDYLYDKQLSFSGASSIGYELLSLDINHYIFIRDHVIFDEIYKVYGDDSNFITIEQSFSKIFDKIVRPWLKST